jgi:hypothetical protein
MSATCVCGSDLWSYRGISPVKAPTPFGHRAMDTRRVIKTLLRP